MNASHWIKAGGPVFLMIGGEGRADPSWIAADSEIMVNADKYRALVVFIEHRLVSVHICELLFKGYCFIRELAICW